MQLGIFHREQWLLATGINILISALGLAVVQLSVGSINSKIGVSLNEGVVFRRDVAYFLGYFPFNILAWGCALVSLFYYKREDLARP